MSQTGYTPIQLYRTTTSGAAPVSGNLNPGELAININDADMALYAKNNTGTVKRLINNPAGLKYPTTDGTANQAVVTDGSGNLSLGTPALATTATTATNLASGSAGTIPYQSASGTTAMLAAGTLGQVLTSAGAAAPTWSTPAAATKTISNKTAAYTVVAGDLGSIINCTSGTFTVSLTAAASLGSGFTCTIWNTSNTSTDVITIDPSSTETIDGVSTLILRRGEGMDIVCNGTNWQTSYKKVMRGYAENLSNTTTRAVASGDTSVAIGSSATASGTNSYAFGQTGTASGLSSMSLHGGNASADVSIAIGFSSGFAAATTATGAGAMALGGSYASGTDSFAAAIGNNTSSYGATNTGAIAMGSQSKATGAYSSIGIGYQSVSSNNGTVALGTLNIANAGGSIAIGDHAYATGDHSYALGYYVTASGSSSYALGVNTLASQIGKYVFGYASFQGYTQAGTIVLRAATNATAVALTSDGNAASTNNQLIVASGQAMAIQGTLIAKVSGTGAMAGWNITGIVSNQGGTMAVSGLALTAIGSDSITLGAQPTIAVDNTNKGVTITCGYKSATAIYWVATVNTSEVVA